MNRAIRWLNRPYNVRHWALRVLSRGAPTVLNATHQQGTLVIDGDHAYVHNFVVKMPDGVRVVGARHVTLSETSVAGGAAFLVGGKP